MQPWPSGQKHSVDAAVWTLLAWLGSARVPSFMDGAAMLARSELTESLVIGANEPPVFLAGDVLFYLTGNMSNAFKTKLLNLFRGTSILGISPHFSLWNGSPEETGSELAGDN